MLRMYESDLVGHHDIGDWVCVHWHVSCVCIGVCLVRVPDAG